MSCSINRYSGATRDGAEPKFGGSEPTAETKVLHGENLRKPIEWRALQYSVFLIVASM